MPASAISLVEPAATGLVMQTLMSSSSGTTPLSRAIDVQTLFTGYSAWPSTQLPHGGLSVLASVSNDTARQTALAQVTAAYTAAINQINSAKSSPMALQQIATTISNGITTYYGKYGMTLPAAAIAAALIQNELVFRDDLTMTGIATDLSAFLNEVTNTTVPANFYKY